MPAVWKVNTLYTAILSATDIPQVQSLYSPNRDAKCPGNERVMAVFPCCAAVAMASITTEQVSGQEFPSPDSNSNKELDHGNNNSSITTELQGGCQNY